MREITLVSDALRLVLRPERGGGVARLDHLVGEPIPLFRPWGETRTPDRLACYPLLPWSNRISGGGIEAGGRFWPLAPNVPGEPYPIHGDAWQKPWAVIETGASLARLALDSRDEPPFDYHAELTYEVEGPRLTMRLAVEHRGDAPAPYGIGFHPWLPRTPRTMLEAAARGVWLETADHLPDREVAVYEQPEWDFSHPRPLPASWINNAFTGWNGSARVRWPEHGLKLDIAASRELSTCIIYSPSAAADFVCFEPVSHPVDAFHLPGMPGLRVLRAGDRLDVSCSFAAALEEGE